MLKQILKKDMMKRKGVNTILFLFITLSTIFLASSINNIMIVGSAVDYYLDYANVPDINVVLNVEKDKEVIDSWLDEQRTSGLVEEYDYNQFLEIGNKSVMVIKDNHQEPIENRATSLFLSKLDVDYCNVFDMEGKEIILQDGEIAIANSMMKNANLKQGDRLRIQNQGVVKEFVIKTAAKDAAYGSEMVGMSRFIVNENDYKLFDQVTSKIGLYYIMTPDTVAFSKQFNSQGFAGIMNIIPVDTYKMVYLFDMIMAGLLILIGLCLISIALLVLRFTLVFSLEEQYQEIGILKAMGLRNFAIKKLYLIKYLVIVTIGATLGTVISIPVSNIMIDSVNDNMIMASSDLHVGVNILCAISIVVLVLSFCYFCTRKLNKVSAITAIRGGYTGERFHENRGFHLSRWKRFSIPAYLGANDIMSHLTRYIVLIITFCLSFILITIPLNTINTMRSEEMVEKFYIDPSSSVYVRKIEMDSDLKYHSTTDLLNGMNRLSKEMKEKGYDAELTGEPIFFLNYTMPGQTSKLNIMTVQLIGKQKEFTSYDQGTAPKLENEIAFSKKVLKTNGWSIGDDVTVIINGVEKTMIITGSYSDYMQLGDSARLNANIDCSKENMFDYWTIMVDMDTSKPQEEVVAIMEKEFPNYEWQTAQQLVDHNIGGVQQSLDQMLLPMTVLLCAVIMLITVLMEKLFITREKGQIAMMKSIGFNQRTICHWQVIRMVLVVIASTLISIPLSLLVNQFVLKPVFAIMGADVAIQIHAMQVYIIYPGILLIGIIIATLVATHSIKNINIFEMNNLE